MNELDAVLRPERASEQWEGMSDEDLREAIALEQIDIGVLRSVAARLLGQRTQQSNASHRIYEGANAILELRRERDERWAAGRRAEAAARRKPRAATKKRAPARRKSKSEKPVS